MTENHVHWTPTAKQKREAAIGSDTALRQLFMATEQSLRERPFAPGVHSVDVFGTEYRLTIEVDRDRMLKVTFIEVLDVIGS